MSLVEPVATYGVEVYSLSDSEFARFHKAQAALWRKLLRVGGRAPTDACQVLLGVESCAISMRVERVGLLLRLVNSLPGSLQQTALIVVQGLGIDWYAKALADLELVRPVRLRIESALSGDFVTSSGWWSDEGRWMIAQAFELLFGTPRWAREKI